MPRDIWPTLQKSPITLSTRLIVRMDACVYVRALLHVAMIYLISNGNFGVSIRPKRSGKIFVRIPVIIHYFMFKHILSSYKCFIAVIFLQNPSRRDKIRKNISYVHCYKIGAMITETSNIEYRCSQCRIIWFMFSICVSISKCTLSVLLDNM